MSVPWRLIVDGALDGALNMGVDEALLESVAAGGPPTLRLYRWERPTASLGRFQPASDADAAVCARESVAIVRRPTGGRGVLHDREVTYSVTACRVHGVPAGTAASYAYLCAGLAEAYRRLGVAAELTRRERGDRTGACYLHATRADLSLGAAKLSGSAQVWRGGCVLQHGSVVLARDTALEAAVFGLGEDGRELLERVSVALEEVLGAAPSTVQAENALADGFASALGIRFEQGGLAPGERERAHELARGAVVAAGPEVRPAV